MTRMPQLFVKTTTSATTTSKKKLLKKWWRQLTSNKSSSSSSQHSDTSSQNTTTLDWRSLSPDRPPLPFFLLENNDETLSTANSARSINYNTNSSNNIILTITTTLPIENNNITNLESTTTSLRNNNNNNSANSNNNNKPIPRTTNTTDNYNNQQPLCPILEESETMVTDSITSNVNNNSGLSPSSIIMHKDNMTSVEEEDFSVEQQDPTTRRHHEKQPLVVVAPSSIIDNVESTASTASFHPPPVASTQKTVGKLIQNTPSDQYMVDEIVGDEERCRRKFAKMVLAANKFQNQEKDASNSSSSRPSHMALSFDVNGNIDMMRMVRQGKSEYHKFCGNSQYVPPELSTNIEYHSELADIWVLGIFLYRMLVGKYPFSAPNDQQLFKKMLHSNFTIPNELSEDAKDLLRRMLAPDMTRASLDLVIYHPWLKLYRPLLLDHYYSAATATTTKNDFINNNNHPPLQQRNTTIKRSNSSSVLPLSLSNKQTSYLPSSTKQKKKSRGLIKKAILLLVQGPFPPPKEPYRDLSHLGTRESVFARQKV